MRSAVGSGPVRLRIRIGKTAGVSRSTVSVGVGRQFALRLSATRFCTCCSATIMSVAGSNCAEISVAPRMLRRAHAADARHLHHRLLDRPRHRQHHRLRRQRAAVGDDDDARKLERRIDAAGQRERGDRAGDDQRDRDQSGGARVPDGQRADRHGSPCPAPSLAPGAPGCATVIAASSGNPFWLLVMTCSPAFTPLTDLHVLAVAQADRHVPPLCLLSGGDEHRRRFALTHQRRRSGRARRSVCVSASMSTCERQPRPDSLRRP